ncbi:unnamed protein product [Closterium sp. Naga37s-1]|nr:unnamed protein product [Closterium sp. Naga37s-1]
MRRTGRLNAGRRAADRDMVYYGTASRVNSGRTGRATSPGDDSDDEMNNTENDTGYATWAANQEEDEDVGEPSEVAPTELVDEDAEAARSRQRSVTTLSHAAPVTPVVIASGGRGPTVAATGGVNVPAAAPAPAPAMNAAMAARLRAREREIVYLNSRLREARRTGNRNGTEGDADTQGQRNVAPATTRQRTRESNPTVEQRGPGPQHDRVYTQFVAQALARETAIVRGRHGPPTEQLVIWADNLELTDKFIPGLLNGLKDAVGEGIKLLVYATRSRRMSFWPSPVLIEATMARALRLRTRAQRQQLHLVWTNDAARSGWFIRKMQVFRNTRWEQGRAYVYVLNGLPYEPPTFSRVAVPADMTANGVPQVSREDFIARHRAGPGTFQLLAWHVLNGLPFAADSFERGIYKSFRRASPPPLVEFPLINGGQMPRSAPQNDEAVRWYHDRVVEWARRSIMASTPASGPCGSSAHETLHDLHEDHPAEQRLSRHPVAAVPVMPSMTSTLLPLLPPFLPHMCAVAVAPMIPTMTYTRITQQSNHSHVTILFNRPCPAFRCNARYCSLRVRESSIIDSAPWRQVRCGREYTVDVLPTAVECMSSSPAVHGTLRVRESGVFDYASWRQVRWGRVYIVDVLPTALTGRVVVRVQEDACGPLPAPRSYCSPHPPPVPPPYLRNFTVALVATAITPTCAISQWRCSQPPCSQSASQLSASHTETSPPPGCMALLPVFLPTAIAVAVVGMVAVQPTAEAARLWLLTWGAVTAAEAVAAAVDQVPWVSQLFSSHCPVGLVFYPVLSTRIPSIAPLTPTVTNISETAAGGEESD